MSGTYTSDEKVEFALKTALFRTMQSKDQPTSLEDPAPPRIFPNNIMKVNLIQKGEGDIDEDGYYVGRTDSASAYYLDNNLVDLEKAELVISNYRIIDPSNNVVTNKRVSDLTTVNLSQTRITAINALPTTGTVYPKKNWFFRGHYGSASGTTAFNNASSSYDGLQLAWDKSTVGATPTEADIVPHLKFYLQVQTKYTNVAHGDNISYAHDLMKGLIGLDQGFTTTLKVNQGEGGSCTTLGDTGKAAGNFWFTQATSGTLSFYGVGGTHGSLVNASDSLSNLNSTKFPMISYIRYTGETGFGAGTGGGGGGSVTLASADSNVSNMIGGTAQTMTTTTFNFDGNVGIGTDVPDEKLHIKGGNLKIERPNTEAPRIELVRNNSTDTFGGDLYQDWAIENSGGTFKIISGHLGNGNTTVLTSDGTNVGIGTDSPNTNLHIKNNTDTTGTGDAFITGLTSNSSNRKPTECLRLQGYYNSSGSGALIRFTNYHASGSNPSNDEYNLAGIAGYDVKGDWGGGLCFYTAPSTIAGGDLTTRMVIDNVGNVGIGTSSPDYPLQIERNASNHSNATGAGEDSDGGSCNLCLKNSFGGYGGSNNYQRCRIVFKHANGGLWGSRIQSVISAMPYGTNNHDGSDMDFWVRGWGNGGSGTQYQGSMFKHTKLHYNGTLYVQSGHVYANGSNVSSDDRVKHNEKTVSNALDSINKLKLKRYIKSYELYEKNHNFVLDNSDNPLDNSGNPLREHDDYFIEAGFIAQEVRNIPEFTEFVDGEEYKEEVIEEFEKDPSGDPILDESGNIIVTNRITKQVPNKIYLNYNNLFCYHIQATQELDRKVIALESENAELKTEVATLKSELAAIKQHLGI